VRTSRGRPYPAARRSQHHCQKPNATDPTPPAQCSPTPPSSSSSAPSPTPAPCATSNNSSATWPSPAATSRNPATGASTAQPPKSPNTDPWPPPPSSAKSNTTADSCSASASRPRSSHCGPGTKTPRYRTRRLALFPVDRSTSESLEDPDDRHSSRLSRKAVKKDCARTGGTVRPNYALVDRLVPLSRRFGPIRPLLARDQLTARFQTGLCDSLDELQASRASAGRLSLLWAFRPRPPPRFALSVLVQGARDTSRSGTHAFTRKEQWRTTRARRRGSRAPLGPPAAGSLALREA